MRQRCVSGLVAVALMGGLYGVAGAVEKVRVTREENKPAKVTIITFGKNVPQFYLGKGDNRIKFTEPGTYEYTVHISRVKGHGHTGTIEVK